MTRLDHLVFGAADLTAGCAWMTEHIGAAPVGAGKHPAMSTHNALWRIGDSYLEVIAIDPDAPHPGRPRWYGLDDPGTQAQLATEPMLLTWVVEHVAPEALPEPTGPALPFTRDALSWTLTVPEDGLPPCAGHQPAIISWGAGTLSPGLTLPDQGLGLVKLGLAENTALRKGLGDPDWIEWRTQGPMSATLRRADGSLVILT